MRGALMSGLGALLLSAASTSRAQGDIRVVTLITGDQVAVAGEHGEVVSILPGAGREKVGFATERVELGAGEGRHLLVIPDDARPLLAADELDRRLFDVSALIAFGYDDAHRDELPVIISYAPPSGAGGSGRNGSGGTRAASPPASARSTPGTVFRKDLPSIHAVSAAASKNSMAQLWGSLLGQSSTAGAQARAAAPPVGERIQKVWLDRVLSPVLEHSVPQVGAPAAWALGLDGDGVVVAVIDSGVDSSHPDLIDRVIGDRNFTDGSDLDEDGHGTHVASTIAGTGAAGGGRYRGVAPGAQILSGKVCDDATCLESAIIEGVQWAVAEEGARIVSISLGGFDGAEIDPLEQAVTILTADYDALFVIAAGNSGPRRGSVESPGSVDVALTVGAVDVSDQVAEFSSRGPLPGFRLKPDVTAPGVGIVAARAAGTASGEPIDDFYTRASGTSMATPHVSGAAALLLQQHPDWGASELKRALMSTASYDAATSVLDQGGGRVDVASAIELALLADASSIELGVARWPHEDDVPLTRTVEYRNLGSATELSFDLDVRGPDGAPAPAGMFTLSPASASLAEGGAVSVTITADTRVAALDGAYGGRLIASGSAHSEASIPLLVQREPESYDLTLRHLDRRGLPTNDYLASVQGRDELLFVSAAPALATPGELTVRLPKGRYLVESTVPAGSPEPPAYLLAPNQLLDSDRVLVLDARVAKAVTALPPSPSATFSHLALRWQISGANGTRFFLNGPFSYTGVIEPSEPELFSSLTAEWFDASVSPTVLYSGSWATHGALPAGVKAMEPDQLATVHATYAAPVPAQDAHFVALSAARAGAGEEVTIYFPAPVELPLERTEVIYSDSDEMRWYRNMAMFGIGIAYLATPPTVHIAGQVESRVWNEAPFTPLLFDDEGAPSDAFRRGDTLVLDPQMYSDGDGYFYTLPSEAQSTLYRDGEPIAQTATVGGEFEVPPEAATYRLEVQHRQIIFQQSTEQAVAWTFSSAHVAGNEARALPLLTVDFAGPVSVSEPTETGGALALPFDVVQYGRATPPDLASLAVSASYDDGSTWVDATVQRTGAGWSARLEPPPGAVFVSLRASAADLDANALEQTAIRAYRLEP